MTVRTKLSIVGVMLALLIGSGLSVYRKVQIASADDAVRNRLRNLSALADDYFEKHGVSSVYVTQLDRTKVYNMGIREPLDEVHPALIQKGQVLEAPSFDGKRVVRFSP